MDMFAFCQANMDLVQNPTLEKSMKYIGSSPYWIVLGRLCYPIHSTPEYILHRNLPVPATYISAFDDYLHVNLKKPLYAMSSYTHAQLSHMMRCMKEPEGTKAVMYARIKSEMDKNEDVVKKLIQGNSVHGLHYGSLP